jgi:hypothetical protein
MKKKTSKIVVKDLRIRAVDNGYIIEYTLYIIAKDNRYEYLKNHNVYCKDLDTLLNAQVVLFKKYPLDSDD